MPEGSRASIPPRRIQGPYCFFRITKVVEYEFEATRRTNASVWQSQLESQV